MTRTLIILLASTIYVVTNNAGHASHPYIQEEIGPYPIKSKKRPLSSEEAQAGPKRSRTMTEEELKAFSIKWDETDKITSKEREFLQQFRHDLAVYIKKYEGAKHISVQQMTEAKNLYSSLADRYNNGFFVKPEYKYFATIFCNYLRNPDPHEKRYLSDPTLPFSPAYQYLDSLQGHFTSLRNETLEIKDISDVQTIQVMAYQLRTALENIHTFLQLDHPSNLRYFILAERFKNALSGDNYEGNKLIDPQTLSSTLIPFTPEHVLESFKKDYANWRVLTPNNDKNVAAINLNKQLFTLTGKGFFNTSAQLNLATRLVMAFADIDETMKTGHEFVGECHLQTLPHDVLQVILNPYLIQTYEGLCGFRNLHLTNKHFNQVANTVRQNIQEISYESYPGAFVLPNLPRAVPKLQRLSIIGKAEYEAFGKGLKSIGTLKNLTTLKLEATDQYKGLVSFDWQFLQFVPTLKELSLRGFCGGGIPKNTSPIESLSLCGYQTQQEKFDWSKKLNFFEGCGDKLTSLSLENTSINDKRSFVHFLTMSLWNVKNLNLRGVSNLAFEFEEKDPKGWGLSLEKTKFSIIDYLLDSRVKRLELGGWDSTLAGPLDLTPEHPGLLALPQDVEVIWAKNDGYHPQGNRFDRSNCNQAWQGLRLMQKHGVESKNKKGRFDFRFLEGPNLVNPHPIPTELSTSWPELSEGLEDPNTWDPGMIQ
jgi:hypothetical protein